MWLDMFLFFSGFPIIFLVIIPPGNCHMRLNLSVVERTASHIFYRKVNKLNIYHLILFLSLKRLKNICFGDI